MSGQRAGACCSARSACRAKHFVEVKVLAREQIDWQRRDAGGRSRVPVGRATLRAEAALGVERRERHRGHQRVASAIAEIVRAIRLQCRQLTNLRNGESTNFSITIRQFVNPSIRKLAYLRARFYPINVAS